MIALAYLFAAAIYFWLTAKACSWAWKRGAASGGPRRARLYAIGVVALAYHLIFWDFIPVTVMHSYYCHRDGGLKIHISADQWLEENANDLAGLAIPREERISQKDIVFPGWEDWDVTAFNRAVLRLHKSEKAGPSFLGIERQRYKLLDIRENTVLLEQINYRAGKGLMYQTLRPQPYFQSCPGLNLIPTMEVYKYGDIKIPSAPKNSPNIGASSIMIDDRSWSRFVQPPTQAS